MSKSQGVVRVPGSGGSFFRRLKRRSLIVTGSFYIYESMSVGILLARKLLRIENAFGPGSWGLPI